MGRWIVIPLMTFVAAAIQVALLAMLPVFGAHAGLVLLLVVAVAIFVGPEWAAVAGFMGGLMLDILGVLPLGLTALSFTLVGFVVGEVVQRMDRTPDFGFQLALVVGASVVGELIVLGLVLTLGQGMRGVTPITIVVTAVYNCLLAAIFLRPLGRVLATRGRGAM